MKIKDIIKKQTTVIAIAVILVVVAAIGLSYSVFFAVKKNSSNQVITAGTLQLTVADISALTLSSPITNTEGLTSRAVSYTVKNTNSNLPAAYTIYIYADSSNTLDVSKIKVSLDGNASAGSTFKALNSIASETITLKDGTTTRTGYKIGSGTIAAGGSEATKYIRVWVDEDLITDELVNKKVSLYLHIVSVVQE